MLVDGKPTASLSSATTSSARVGGHGLQGGRIAGHEEGRGPGVRHGKRVVYIYHNTVDAVGDTASTEAQTFEAVRTAIDELAALVGYIVNNLNGNYVVVTADHGFLFTETAPGETDKSKLDEKPDGHGDGEEALPARP